MWLWLTGIAFLLLRLVWEYSSPITPFDSKIWLYFRDFLTLFPASICLTIAIFRHGKSMFSFKVIPVSKKQFYWIAFIFSLVITLLCTLVSLCIFKTHALVVDEVVYLFQAKVFLEGRFAAPAPELPGFFQVHFMAIKEDRWFGIFFPGYSLVLSLGLLIHKNPYFINPILSGILVFLTMLITKKWFNYSTSLITGLICLISPFFLFQGASYFSHILSAIFVLSSVYFFLETLHTKSAWTSFGFGVSLGLLEITRPMSAIVIIIFCLILLMHRLKIKEIHISYILKYFWIALLGFGPFIVFHFFYNYRLVDNAFYLPRDYGMGGEDFSLHYLWKNSLLNLIALSVDFLGAPIISLIPFLLFSISQHKLAKPFLWLVIINFICYGLYSFHGISYGPRFHFELMPFIFMGSAYWLLISSETLKKCSVYFGGFPPISVQKTSWKTTNFLHLPKIVLAFVIMAALISYIGIDSLRFNVYSKKANLFDIENYIQNNVKTPALIFIKPSTINEAEDRAIPYLGGFQLNSIYLKNDYVYAKDLESKNYELTQLYPTYRYYTFELFTKKLTPLKEATVFQNHREEADKLP